MSRRTRKARYSEKDDRGKAWTDCYECEKGSIGSNVDRCAAGLKISKGGKGGCFCGILRGGLHV